MDAKDIIIAEMTGIIADLKALLKAAMEKIAALEKNSRTSHKPPDKNGPRRAHLCLVRESPDARTSSVDRLPARLP